MQRKAQESREKGEKETGDLSPEEEALVGGPQISLKKGSSTKQDGSSSNGVLNLNEAMFPPLHSACNGNSIVAIGAEKDGNPDLVNGTLSESFENDVNISESGDEGKTEIEIIQDLGDEAKLEILPDSVDVVKVEIHPDLEYPSQARFVESKTGVIEIPETVDFHGPGIIFPKNTDLIQEASRTLDSQTGKCGFAELLGDGEIIRAKNPHIGLQLCGFEKTL